MPETPTILYEDEWLLVLNKPFGCTVNRSDTTRREMTVQDWVEEYLKIRNTKYEIQNKSKIQNSTPIQSGSNDQNGLELGNLDFEFLSRAGIAHRIDKETSGILLVAKTPLSFYNLQLQFKERVVKKTYLALSHGKILPQEGEINVPVGRLPWNRTHFGVVAGGREAVTFYKALSYFPWNRNNFLTPIESGLTLVELYPRTGRTHQLRVHLKYLHHPIFGDPLYGGRKQSKEDRKYLSRLFLHASKISFLHPENKKTVSFESPLPEELLKMLTGLRKG